MPGIGYPPVLQFGLDASLQNSVQLSLANAVAVDAGANNAGVTATGTTAANAYQIRAGTTVFGFVSAGTGAVLPNTSGAVNLQGLEVAIQNSGLNFLTVYPGVGDVGGTINGGASVVLMPASITAFYCLTTGVWVADGIGAGAAGSIQTVASQGAIASAGTSQTTATKITQALVNVTTGTGTPAGVTLPPAVAGLEIAVANNLPAAATLLVYATGSDTINGTAGATGVSQATGIVTLYYVFTAGAYLTK
jgi:hypothetical protein